GIVAGTAGVLKLSAIGTALIPVGVVALVGLADGIMQQRVKTRLIGLVAFGLAALAALAPWLLRATLIGGHPFFPFKGEGPGWAPEQGAFVIAQHHPQSILSAEYWTAFPGKINLFGYPVVILSLSIVALTALIGSLFQRRLRGLVIG